MAPKNPANLVTTSATMTTPSGLDPLLVLRSGARRVGKRVRPAVGEHVVLEVVEELLEPGKCVVGYELEYLLGEGGMGVVWSAREQKTGKRVALKFLRERGGDGLAQLRFEREANAMMAIRHPNVIALEAVLETDLGTPFLVMERLEGESLRSRLVRRGSLTAAECARIGVRVADAIAAAHAGGVVHRDLKPENVFLTRCGNVKVLDFGVAKQMVLRPLACETLTSPGTLVGTSFYMAPEQVFGDAIDGRVDVWALGILLYECVAGVRPTEGVGFGQVLKRITTEPFVPLTTARPGTPARLAALVARMLARPRDERPGLDEIRTTLLSTRLDTCRGTRAA